MNVSAYLFKDGYDSLRRLRQARERVGRARRCRVPRRSADADDQRAIHRNSLAPVSRAVAGVCRRCRTRHPSAAESPPPGWRCCVHRSSSVRGSTRRRPRPSLTGCCAARSAGGTIVVPSPDDPAQVELRHPRRAMPVVVGGATVGYVITDLPIGVDMAQRLEDATRVHAGAALLIADGSEQAGRHPGQDRRSPDTTAR